MKLHRHVVFSDWLRGFDWLDEAIEYARCVYPCVVCERVSNSAGKPVLRERMRHDFLNDAARDEWGIRLASVGIPDLD
jgi:hypothetical protein